MSVTCLLFTGFILIRCSLFLLSSFVSNCLLKRVVLAFLSVYSDEGLASETSVSYLLLFTVFNLSFYHLIDQFLQVVKDPEIVRKILENAQGLQLSFKGAIDFAVTVENNEKSSPLYAKPSQRNDASVHCVSQHTQRNNSDSGSKSPKKCYRCGSTQHLAEKCRHKKSICHSCGKEGHYAVACMKRKRREANFDDMSATGEQF